MTWRTSRSLGLFHIHIIHAIALGHWLSHAKFNFTHKRCRFHWTGAQTVVRFFSFPPQRLLLSMVEWRHTARNWWWSSGGDRHRPSQKMHEASGTVPHKSVLIHFAFPHLGLWSKQESVQARLDNPSMRCYPSAGSPGVVNAGNAHLGQEMAFQIERFNGKQISVMVLLVWCCIWLYHIISIDIQLSHNVYVKTFRYWIVCVFCLSNHSVCLCHDALIL